MCKEDWGDGSIVKVFTVHSRNPHRRWTYSMTVCIHSTSRRRWETETRKSRCLHICWYCLRAESTKKFCFKQGRVYRSTFKIVLCIPHEHGVTKISHQHINLYTQHTHTLAHTLSHTLRHTQRNAQCAKGDECSTISLG